MIHARRAACWKLSVAALGALLLLAAWPAASRADWAQQALQKIDQQRGIVCLLGLPPSGAQDVIQLAEASQLQLYLQSADESEVRVLCEAADAAGLLGTRVFVDAGSLDTIRLADNVADAALVSDSAADQVDRQELLRVMRPQAAAHLGQQRLVKPAPEGIDQWTHPYHGPDNNPQSTDQLARGQLRTQFLAEPKFSPMPEQTVVAGGRIYKAMGHIAHKANQNAMLNTLLCINAYNGTILWKRPLPEGFMLHRNTMVATDDALYMGDHQSCKIIDGRSGLVRGEITAPAEVSDGPVWKWMAIVDDVLYGLVGHQEVQVDTRRSDRRGLGHWGWGMWQGHDYGDLNSAFGFGRTVVAIDLETRKVLWHYRDNGLLDARALCMNDDRIYCYSPQKFVACIQRDGGKLLWKNSDQDLLEAIGPNGRAQHYITGYATTCYMKCNNEYLFFAGPQRARTVVASASDGSLAWTHPVGNSQLVLRQDAIHAAGPQDTSGYRLDYATGKVLDEFPARRACTRATGSVDSIFYRASGGTVRVLTETKAAHHIGPMRPPCQDGVIISNGHFYWGPWMCGCQLSLYGNIGLAPAPERPREAGDALETFGDLKQVADLQARPNDWTAYRGDNRRSDSTAAPLASATRLRWSAEICRGELPTAPVAAGGLVFVADRRGAVQALDGDGQRVWKAYTAGAVYYPPAVAQDRLFVGSADGRVYAFEARTGRLLWRRRVAPNDDRIPVFGKLVSSWPVAGGVAVQDGVVYVAAGITHYDGTYVAAIDAVTGELITANDSSGKVAVEVDNGISMQGELAIVGDELQFLGGGVYETARYDLRTLQCLNTPKIQVNSQYRTAFYPYYPAYGKYVSLEHTCGDGNILCHDASYEGSMFANLTLELPPPPGQQRQQRDAARENYLRRRGRQAPPERVWQDKQNRRFTSFIVAGDKLLAAGHPDRRPADAFVAAINVQDGTDVWLHKVSADAVKGGAAIDHDGRIYVALEDGKLLCYEAQE